MRRKKILLGFSLLSAVLPGWATHTVTDGVTDSTAFVEPARPKRLQAVRHPDDYDRFRFGGYGEMLAKFMDYGTNRFYGGTDNSDHRSSVSIPRFVLAFDYKFTSRWILSAEIEFEAGGVGVATELENSENGEYETEMEKGGEVALEQFHLTRLLHPAFNVRAGHLIVPVGLTNAHHEPIHFFGTSRPEGETTVLPSTWHETGLELFGSFGKGYASFSYQAQVVAGMSADGFGRDYWVSGGRQGLFEADNFTSPAYVARLDYKGVPGLRVGGAAYYCHDVTANTDKPYKYSEVGRSGLFIWSADVQYVHRCLTVRGNVISGTLQHSDLISAVALSNKSGYYQGAMRKVARRALAYGVEAGVNVSSFFAPKKCPVIYPFVRYEYYNPQEQGEKGVVMEKRNQVSKWTAGLNWFALPNLVLKADYTTRRIGTAKLFGSSSYKSENEWALGIAYVGWFTRR